MKTQSYTSLHADKCSRGSWKTPLSPQNIHTYRHSPQRVLFQLDWATVHTENRDCTGVHPADISKWKQDTAGQNWPPVQPRSIFRGLQCKIQGAFNPVLRREFKERHKYVKDVNWLNMKSQARLPNSYLSYGYNKHLCFLRKEMPGSNHLTLSAKRASALSEAGISQCLA